MPGFFRCAAGAGYAGCVLGDNISFRLARIAVAASRPRSRWKSGSGREMGFAPRVGRAKSRSAVPSALPGDAPMAVSAPTQPGGVYAAVLTPLNAALEPDPALFVEHCRWL